MKRWFRSATIVLAMVVSWPVVECAVIAPSAGVASTNLGDAQASLMLGDHEFQVQHGGRKRYYLVHVPPGGGSGKPQPVVLAIRWWVQHNGCPAQPREGELLRGTPGSKEAAHTAQRLVYGPCREGTEVALLRLTGAGHGWPGGTSILSERIMGPATSVINASEELWAFFRRFSRPDAPPLN